MHKMTPQDFLEKVKQAYHDAMTPTMPGEDIFRHRVRSTSGAQEDIVAYFIRSQADNLQVHIDQPITIRPSVGAPEVIGQDGKNPNARSKTWYPDIVVVQRHQPSDADGTIGTIIALIDVKTDLGWKRDDESFRSICNSLHSVRAGLLEGRHQPLPGPPRRSRKVGGAKPVLVPNFDIARLRCADRMTCHVVVVTAANSGNIDDVESSRQAIARNMGVHLHVLMKLHPNMSKQQIATVAGPFEEGLTTSPDQAGRWPLRLKDFESLSEIILGTMT